MEKRLIFVQTIKPHCYPSVPQNMKGKKKKTTFFLLHSNTLNKTMTCSVPARKANMVHVGP